jgi:hypothetical protein
MIGLEASLIVAWQACGRDQGGGRRRGQQGGAMGGELQGEGHGGAAGLPLRALCFASCLAWRLLCVRERKETGGRRRREEKKRKKKKEKKKKYETKFKLENFWKIKDNLWS